MKKILIVGGGASGLAAAISAAEAGAAPVLIEAREQTGKKLLKTGSGRCNFTNAYMDPDRYYGGPGFIRSFLGRFSTEDCLGFFGELGLLARERDGYYYPYSNSAASVLSVLNARLRALQVPVLLNSPVTHASVLPDGRFSVKAGERTLTGDSLIISSGSPAGADAPAGPFSWFPELKVLRITPYLPALTMLYGSEGCERVWDGVRCRGSVTALGRTETGELQLLAKGISGIPVFQVSRMAVRALQENEPVTAELDFMPDYGSEEVRRLLTEASDPDRGTGTKTLEELLRGWLPRKLIPVILRRAGLFSDREVSGLSGKESGSLREALKHFTYRVTGHGSFREAQTVSGGVDTAELNDDFEARKIPGLYFTGETVDIDGMCGGYNLHFAFGSGIIAGKAAARELKA